MDPFIAPANAPGYQSFLSAAAAAGYERDEVRRFLACINAHPHLIAHARVFQHIGILLTELLHADSGFVRPWHECARVWIGLCAFAWERRYELAAQVGLAEFNKGEGRDVKSHPLMRAGLTRHPLVAALWNQHAVGQYPPPDDNTAARTHFAFQGRMLEACIDARFELISVEEYEQCDLKREDIRAPAAVGPGALALREFSLPEYAPLLSRLSLVLDHEQFMNALLPQELWPGRFEGFPKEATRHLTNLRRFFAQANAVAQSATVKRSSTGGRRSHTKPRRLHHGNLAFGGVDCALVTPPLRKPDDVDIEWTPAVQVLLKFPGEVGAATEEDEVERLEHAFDLYPVAEIEQALRRLRYQNFAMAAAAQRLPFAWSRLTQCEIRAVGRLINALFDDTERSDSRRRGDQETAAVLMVMLLLGQTIDAAVRTEFLELDGPWAGDLSVGDVSHPTLLLQANWEHRLQGSRVVGFLMPAISPDYRTELPSEALALGQPRATAFLLRDPVGLGERLAAFLMENPRPNHSVFGIRAETARKTVGAALASLNEPRITHSKVSLVLESEILQRTDDPLLANVVTSQLSRSNQTRLYYTQFQTQYLRDIHERCVLRIARIAGIRRPTCPQLQEDSARPTLPSAWVGCRFVATKLAITQLIAHLQKRISEKPRAHDARDLGAYIDAYVLYCCLYQNFSTTLRPIRRAGTLVEQWQGGASDALSITDKSSRFLENSRLVSLLDGLDKQFRLLAEHQAALRTRFALQHDLANRPEHERHLLVPDAKGAFTAITPGWVANTLSEIGWPWPANFHRAYMRTTLSNARCSPQVIDALMGHAALGESPFQTYSTFDFGRYLTQITEHLVSVVGELGFRPIRSRLAY